MGKTRQEGLVWVGDMDILKDKLPDMEITPQETQDRSPAPSEPEFDNPQLSLFQNFLCNTDEERERFSNAIDLWDSVPRYSVNRQAMTKARENEKYLENHTLT
jgi:hypothetical protein